MSRPENPANTPAERSQTDLRETVLLSEPELARQSSQPSSGTTPALSSQALAVLSERYDILGEAGHGSMGSVYKARDRETGEIVALKLLKPEIASDQVMMDRFKNELLFARKITHKNVCRVHEFNRIGGIAYTSMEFVEGESLRSVLDRFGGLPVRKAVDLAQQICSGLEEAHAQGIVHRDLKPENVMIDAQGNVKIMDFGIARSMEAGTRLTGSMVGTPAYMAPEQVSGKQVDYRADIYSLGLILYEVFTGTPAFQAENAVAVALKQMRELPRPPHEIEPAIPPSVERVIVKCLEKEPARRFQSVTELAGALRGSPITSSRTAPAAPIHRVELPRPAASLPSHPLYGSSALSVARPKRRSSPLLWVLLMAVVGGAAYAGWRQPELRQAVEPLITQLKAAMPKPGPAEAGTPTAPSSEASSSTEPSTSPSTPAAAAHAAVQQPAAPSPPAEGKEAPAQKHKAAVSRDRAPAAVVTSPPPSLSAETERKQVSPGDADDSAAPIVPKRASKPATDDGSLTIPPTNDRVPNYVWVGRYQREDRAQQVSKKISDLGLPVLVVPRPGVTGTVYVVVSGPFGPDRVTSVIDWLKAQGFLGVHPIATVPAERRGVSSNQRDATEP
jgi:serine/threonine protein kinase